MKYYDFKKAQQLIEENKNELQSASLGMHEDWAWTAEEIFADGNFKIELPNDADEMETKFAEARKNGLNMFLNEKTDNGFYKFNPEWQKLTRHQIAGIYSSVWATPALQLVYKDGRDRMIPCYYGDCVEVSLADKIERQINLTSGVISSVVQENITPLECE